MMKTPAPTRTDSLTISQAIWTGLLTVAFSLMSVQTTLAASETPQSSPVNSPQASDAKAAEADERWLSVKREVLGDIEIQDGSALMDLEAPKRAYDAALVPISVKLKQAQSEERYIKELYLFADKNPAPMSGKFIFQPNTGWQNLETRIRVNEYTYVRAVAVMNDDQAYMVSRYVKASGGCSAPALGDAAAAMANVGKFKVKLESSPVEGSDGERLMVNFQIKHPNNSGMQFDQISRLYIPAYFIHTIGVKYDGKEIIKLETNFSLSENPSLRFDFVPEKAGGEIEIYAIDSKLKLFEQQGPS